MITTEEIQARKRGQTFQQLATELGMNVNTLKWQAYRVQLGLPRREFNRVRSRPDYAGIIGGLISELATRYGVTEEAFREWIKTDQGTEEFRVACGWLGVPLYSCNYKAKRKRLLTVRETVGKLGHGKNGTAEDRTGFQDTRISLPDSMHY